MRGKLTIIDSHYLRPEVAAIFLRVEGDEAAIIETATRFAKPLVLAALEERGLRPEQVRYVIVTHAHLDHSGGAHSLMSAFPHARLVAHPRAARHLADPERLEKSARQVYGDLEFERLYGRLEPVAQNRVLALEDGASIPFGAGKLSVMHTRGHAKHHFCVLDPQADAIFTGDSFGLAYPSLQGDGLFIFPSTSPTDFEGQEALNAVDRIVASGAGRALLTHFGEVSRVAEAARQLRGHLQHCIELVEEARPMAAGARQAFFLRRLRERHASILAMDHGSLLDVDFGLNADGLSFSLEREEATEILPKGALEARR